MESRVTPYFSVVIPTYNRAEKLRRSVQSVLDQSFGDFELLVMDDGSTDSSREVIEAFGDDRIRYDWAPNSGGPATPRNRGLDAARADWVCFLDADDIWYPTKLETVGRTIKSAPGLDAVCHDEMLSVLATGMKSLLRHGPNAADMYRTMLLEGNRVSTSAVTVRRAFLQRHGLRFNESRDYVIIEDFDLWLRMALHGATFRFISEPLGEYLIEDDNLTGHSLRHRQNLAVMLKHHVYNIQAFEPDKERLWRQVRVRLQVWEAREKLAAGQHLAAVRILLAAALRSPRGIGGVASAWLRRRFRGNEAQAGN